MKRVHLARRIFVSIGKHILGQLLCDQVYPTEVCRLNCFATNVVLKHEFFLSPKSFLFVVKAHKNKKTEKEKQNGYSTNL